MKHILLSPLIAVALFLMPSTNFAQAPDLGSASSFGAFTAIGAFSNLGITTVVGDIGTNAGAFSSIPPVVLTGDIHVVDGVSAVAAVDVADAYAEVFNLTCGSGLGVTMGVGQILFPNIYCTGAAATLTGNLTLDAQGDPDALFIFQINGAFATSTFASVTLINGASPCNVYWQINGEFDLGDFSLFQGTVLVNGAINLLEGSSVIGRVLSQDGAISLFSNTITIALPAVPAVITASGPTTFCLGGSVTLSGNDDGGVWSTGEITPTITVFTSGDYFVTNTTVCGSVESNHIIVTVNPLPVCSITGDLIICEGETTNLCAPPGLTYLWSTGAMSECITVGVSGLYILTIIDANGCTSTCSVTVTVNPLPVCSITGDLSVCLGLTTELCGPLGFASYLWSTGETSNCIEVSTGGIYTLTVTDLFGCSSTCNVTVTVNLQPVCSITGNLSLCEVGQRTDLCAPLGYVYLWSTGEVSACINVGLAGIYSVILIDLNGCTSTCSVEVTLDPLPVCTITGDLLLCDGESTDLCVPLGAASYLWSNGQTSNCITVTLPGIYTVIVTQANGCTSTCSVTVTVNPLPVCSITGTLLLCNANQTTDLCAPLGFVSYLWNTGATTNCITGVFAGIYTVTVTDLNGCTSTCSVTVTFDPMPACSITGDLLICEGESTFLCVPPGSASYLWSTGAVTNCITVITAGTYSVIITEANGCTSTCSATVAVNPVPVCTITGDLFFCQGQSTQLCAPPGFASYLWNTNEMTDCISVSLAGTYTVIVIDVNGCSSTCSVTVGANPLPVCSITGDLSLCGVGQTTQLCAPPGFASYLWNTGAISNCITAGAAGIYTVTVTDINGCSSTCSVTVTVDPLAVCTITGNLLLCDGASTQLCVLPGAAGYLWSNGGTTNCITVTLPGIYSVIVTQANGCTSTCSVTVTVDSTLPVITCPADLAIECDDSTLPLNTGTATATDNCTLPPTITFSDVILAGLCPQEYTITRTWTATDASGNSSTCIQTITVGDNTPPTLTCPDDITVQCAIQVPAVNVGFVNATDNCGGVVAVAHVSDVITNQICENNYTLTRTYRATDLCGNTATCIQLIRVLDNTPPVITFPSGMPIGDTIKVQCYGQNPEWDIPSFDEGSVVATDNCTGPVTVEFIQILQNQGDCREDGYINLYRLMWTATDACGNSNSVSTFLALVDTIPPVIFGVPQDTIVNCDEIPEAPFSIYATDECLCACIVLLEETTPLSPGCQVGRVIVRTWIAKDDCGNMAIATQNITLMDNEPPVIVGVLDTACFNDPALYNVVAVDNCGGPTVLLFQDFNTPNPCGEGMAIRRVYEAYDACGNISRDTSILLLSDQNISGLEFVNPVLIALDSGEVMTLDYNFTNGNYTSFGVNDVSFESACLLGGFVTFTERVLETGDCTTDGFILLIELKWTAIDICGNTSELIALVQMVDNSSPVFVNFITERTIGCDEEMPENFGTDNSGEVTMVIRDTTIRGDCIYDFDVLRTITLRDSCGNSTTREQTIHVQSRPPVIVGVNEEICDDLSIPEVTAYDPCTGEFVAVTMQEDTLDVPCSGLSIVRTWTAVGSCGHVTVIRQTIIMDDDTPPEIIVPAGSVIEPFLDEAYNVIPSSQIYLIGNLDALDEFSVIVRDDCDQEITPVLTVKITFSEDCEADGYFERRTYTWMATDACGNMAAFTFSVDITDDTPPATPVTVLDSLTIICAPLPPVPEVIFADAAQPVTVVYTETTTPSTIPGRFIVIRTWVATDVCGNSTTVVQHIIWIPDTFLTCEIILPETVECNTHGVIISSEVTGGVGPYTYDWQVVGDSCFIQGGQGDSEVTIYVGWSEVKIILTITDAYGCVSMCMITLPCVNVPVDPFTEVGSESNPETDPAHLTVTGTEEYLKEIRLWPNPASNSVNLSFESVEEGEVEYQLINLLGQVVLRDKINARIGLNSVKIDVSRASEGSHLVEVKTEKEVHTKVIVIMEND